MIKIIDCGSQLTQNIARRIRELGVYTEIVPYRAPKESILTNDLEGIIISGGQFSVYDEGSPLYSPSVLESGIPILGICYGQQSIAYLLGGRVVSTEKREYGRTAIRITKESPLFKGIENKEFNVWMSHGDIVEVPPQGSEVVALSQNNHITAMQNTAKGIYAVQFHPEVDHTQHGRKILNNFVEICNAQRTWDPEKEYDRIVAYLEEKVKGKIGVGGISGGKDSSTACFLVSKIAGKRFLPIFIDNGLLRENEAEEVKKSLNPLGMDIAYIDASERFLSKLKGVTNPDEKRKIIGHEFIYVFEEEARKIGGTYLVQGTLYPDVIESAPIYGSSSKIKRHHNVGGLPPDMTLEIIEPFRHLFKDEVMKMAEEELKIPKNIAWRQPFPGPGLAVRIIGEVTAEKLAMLRKADYIFIDELKKRNLYYEIAQALVVLTDAHSVGVMGDAGTYEAVVGLKAVMTKDFMTADWYDFKKKDLSEIVNRIINEVKGVNRVVYDVSQKPPATIEWE